MVDNITNHSNMNKLPKTETTITEKSTEILFMAQDSKTTRGGVEPINGIQTPIYRRVFQRVYNAKEIK